MRLCDTSGCPHHVREGLRRHGKGSAGQDLADGRTCWRCRARLTTPRRGDLVAPSAKKVKRKAKRRD